jgi:outer membrane protein insertion porin family
MTWLVLTGFCSSVWAAAFTVQDIRVEGLRRISPGTIFTYLPVKVGDQFDEAEAGEAIRALFKTGFFKDVEVEREGETLVVRVVERPSIASITFNGNENLETEELKASLTEIGFAEGEVFNRSVYDRVEQELRRTYFARGKYAVRIKSTVTPLERNRVGVNFEISEGRVATIKKINIVGNEVYDDDELVDLLSLTAGGWLAFFTKSDQYSKQRLSADLETLRSYYLDRGYVNFNIDSTQVSISPDKQDVYITINLTEGDRFRVREVDLTGELVVPEADLTNLVVVREGDVFSRKRISETRTALATRLGQDGYAFANINAVPDIDVADKTVKVTFFIDPGRRVYVRRVNFKGNSKTRDEVLRREMRQIEGAWIDTAKVERSKERLQRLGYFKEVNVETPAVAGTQDQVDLNITVEEQPSGSLLAGLGYSAAQGVIIDTKLTQENFLGTGNSVSFTFSNSDVNRAFGLGFVDPYWTDDGVSLGFDGVYRETDAEDANLASYTLDEAQVGMTLGVPVTEFDSIDLGLRLEHTNFTPGANASTEVLAFDTAVDGQFFNVVAQVSFANDTRNSRFLPDRGSVTRVSAEMAVPGSEVTYYKGTLFHQRFFPLNEHFTLVLQGEVGYGDGYGGTDDLPLTDNFFAGGLRSVRGFESNTLGPRDSRGEPFGGNLKMVGNAELILPVPFLEEVKQFRLSTFFDVGNVFGPNQTFEVGDFRYSAGVNAIWFSPLGALTFSYAVPLKSESTDEEKAFDFTIGTTF